MGVHMIPRRVSVLVACAVLALAVPESAWAANDPEPRRVPHAVPSGPSTADLSAPSDTRGQNDSGVTTQATTGVLISGCTGQSLVYKTGTSGGRANGEGLISCLRVWPKLYDSTNLLRDRWYGIQSLDYDNSTAYNNTWVNSISIYTCAGQGTYTYYSEGYHEVTSSSGTKYRSSTTDGDQFAC